MADFISFGAWKFCLHFDPYSRKTETVYDAEAIKQSLYMLLSTSPGERVMEPNYGCDLSPLAFERLTLSLETQMKSDIKKAIETFEPRVDIKSIYLEYAEVDGCINIKIDYSIKVNNRSHSMIYTYNY
jgi:phage baseplate assembly protein W